MKYLIILLMLTFASLSHAFDASHAGTYAVVHKDGHVTNFHFQVSHHAGAWNVEQKLADGTWKNVTCEKDCILKVTSETDLSKFIPLNVLAKHKFECIENTAFAFCAYRPTPDSNNMNYVLIALVTKPPTPVYLKKVER